MKNEPLGSLSYYDIKGSLYSKGSYRNNLKEGAWENYHENGKISSKGNYKAGKYVDDWELYDETGAVTSVVMYDEYEDLQFYNPEKDKRAYATNDGKQPYSKLYNNGKPEVVGQKNKGFNDSDWKWYYEDGTLKEEGSFKDHQQTGVWKTYYPNGNLQSQATKYSNVSSSSDLVKYYPDGKIKFKKTDDGKYTEFYKTGEVYSVESKVLGVSLGKEFFNKSGKSLGKEPYKFK